MVFPAQAAEAVEGVRGNSNAKTIRCFWGEKN